MQNMSVMASGSGSDIHIATTVQPWSWEPLYIISTASKESECHVQHDDTRQLKRVGLCRHVCADRHSEFIGWLVLRATSSIVSVSSSRTGTLASFGSISSLNATRIGAVCTAVDPSPNLGKCSHFTYNQQGWYYDASHGLLYLHLQVQGPR